MYYFTWSLFYNVYLFAKARQILERHLIISDKAFTMEDLRREANNNYNLSVKLPTVRDVSMYIKVKESSEGKCGLRSFA